MKAYDPAESEKYIRSHPGGSDSSMEEGIGLARLVGAGLVGMLLGDLRSVIKRRAERRRSDGCRRSARTRVPLQS